MSWRDSIIKEIKKELQKEYDKCWYCGSDLISETHLDHIIPKSQGGKDVASNYALTCGKCNRAKLDKDLMIFLIWLAHIRSGNFECYIIKKLGVELGASVNDKLQKSFYK